MDKIIGWQIWFIDLPEQREIKTFTSRNILWARLPKDGILGLVLFENTLRPDGGHTRMMLTGQDYYFKALTAEGDEIYGSCVDTRSRDSIDDMMDRYLYPMILRGAWTSHQIMEKIQEEMQKVEF